MDYMYSTSFQPLQVDFHAVLIRTLRHWLLDKYTVMNPKK